MPALPHMPFFVGDFVSDTTHLLPDEVGAYVLLICSYWSRGGPLPADRVATIARMSSERWAAAEPTLQRLFIVEGTVWRHARIDKELARAIEKSATARANGKARHRPSSAERPLSQRSADAQRKLNYPDSDPDKIDTNIAHQSSAAREASGGAEAPRRTRRDVDLGSDRRAQQQRAKDRSRRVSVESVKATCRRIGLAERAISDVVRDVGSNPEVRNQGPYLAKTMVDHIEHWLKTNGLPPEFSRPELLDAIEGCEVTLARIADAFERCGLTMGQVQQGTVAA